MNPTENLRQRVDALWSDLETHYRPGLTPKDFDNLHALDAAAIDGKLTAANFESTKRRLLDRPRSYAVDHATGKAIGYVHQGPYKALHGDKYIDRRGGGNWRVRISVHGETKTSLHRTKAAAQQVRDYLLEHRASEERVRSIYRADSGDRVSKEIKIVADAKAVADARKAALRAAMKPCPTTGITPSMSEVLRRPEFDLSGEPPRPTHQPKNRPIST